MTTDLMHQLEAYMAELRQSLKLHQRLKKIQKRLPKHIIRSRQIQTDWKLTDFPPPNTVWKLGSVEPDELDLKKAAMFKQPVPHRVLEPYAAPMFQTGLGETIRKTNLSKLEDRINAQGV